MIICGTTVCLLMSRYHGSIDFFREVFGPRFASHPAAEALPYFWWYGMTLLLYLVAPLALARLTGGSFARRYGLGLGEVRVGLAIGGLFLAVMVPVVFVASRFKGFSSHYPLAGQGAFYLQVGKDKVALSLRLFTAYEAAYFLYFIAWEFLFRGWMLNGLLPRFGRAGALLVQTAPFALMHVGKPEAEALGSIVAGLALGILALRTRSFWYGAVLHGLIAVYMDVLASWPYISKP